MSLTEPAFLFLFLPLFLLLFQIGGRIGGSRGALGVILAVSVLIIGTQGRWFLLLTSLSALGDYGILVSILRARSAGRPARPILVAGVALNIAILVAFKYAAWFGWIPTVGPFMLTLNSAVPMTLSFLTFQRAVALLDGFAQPAAVQASLSEPKQGEAPKPRIDGPLRFLTFASFFPNVLIGPIAYLTEVAPQFRRESFAKLRSLDLAVGLTLLVIGLFKKVFIADDLGRLVVDPVYTEVHLHRAVPPLLTAAALVGYFAQLYFDFSGYSDMALGIGRTFGIRLPINFKSPLRAIGIIDFYRRWHITLTRVIARFLFTPLSIVGTRYAMRKRLRGFRAKAISLWGPLLLNFLVIGVWHSASVTFVIFGLFHGLWYVIETEVRSSKRWKKLSRSPNLLRSAAGVLYTSILIAISFALARSPSLEVFFGMFANLHGDWTNMGEGVGPILGIVRRLIFALAIIYLAPNAYELLQRYRPGITTWDVRSTTPAILRLRWRPTLLWGLFVAALGLAVFSRLAQPVPFVYGIY
jgi:D-alanyl-lipoteichoic acid acyltransferase DltB (MBOAT superfamily)